MLISLNRKQWTNFITIIGLGLVLASCCQWVHGSQNDEVLKDVKNSLKKHNELFKEFTERVSHEVESVDIKGAIKQRSKRLLDQFTSPLYLNVSEYPGELCNRVCVKGQNRVCYFQFTIEYYQAMGVACGNCANGVKEDCNKPQCIIGDGVEKGVMSINRQIPGPAIQVCKDDLVIVDVHNNAHGAATSLHWHGLHMVATPYMDGVPFLTQCPISYDNTFRYQYNADIAGTHFYHAHAGHHKTNGLYGALIVRRHQEPFKSVYDYDLPEHHIIISDWMHDFAEQHARGLPNSPTIPDAVLINGRGTFTDPKTGEQTKVPLTIFYVNPGRSYRFRFINSISHACPFQMQIEKHRLKIIASDSYDVHPQEFDTLVSNPGERYDFVLDAKQPKGDYFIRVRGLGLCSTNNVESFAILRYKITGTNSSEEDKQIPPLPKYETSFPNGIFLNHPNATCRSRENSNCITDLDGYEEDEKLLNAKPDHKFFLSFENYPLSKKAIFKPGQYKPFYNPFKSLTLMGAINNISLAYPDYPPLTQPEQMDESHFCDSKNRPAHCDGYQVCRCTHRLKVKLNSIVELVLVDESKEVNIINHPFHLHGYRFMVVGLGQDPNGVPMSIPRAKRMDDFNLLKDYHRKFPPFKDTVSIPSRGYAVVRFKATNPGFWLLHCHYEWHLDIGMALFLQVGDTFDMVEAPDNFPKCGNYLPPVKRHALDFKDLTSLNSFIIS